MYILLEIGFNLFMIEQSLFPVSLKDELQPRLHPNNHRLLMNMAKDFAINIFTDIQLI